MSTAVEIPNDYEPHTGQQKFHDSTAKFKAIITGIGFGKSAAGANEILRNAMLYPKALHLILAPTTKIMDNATLPQFFKFCPREIIDEHLKSKKIITIINGARIIYLTADNDRNIDRLRGIEIGSFWGDEIALVPSYVWDIVLGRLRDPNGPLTGIVTTTPKGMNWVYQVFHKKLHPKTREPVGNPQAYEWFGGTSLDNPYTPEDYKQTLLATYKGKFREQELYGKFVSFEGMVYSNFDHGTHIIKNVVYEKDEQGAYIEFDE